jgi:predicted porin
MRSYPTLLSSLLAAIAAAASAGAQAQSANLTLYGRINLDLELVRGTTSTGSPPVVDDGWVTRLSSNSSRFGLRGSESLGGGLTAIFQIESSVSADAGGGTIAGRDTWIGLRGEWGTVRFGYLKTPYDTVNGVMGNTTTFTSSILDTESVWGNGSSLASGGFPYRAPNSVRYDFPGRYIEGLNWGAQYSFTESNSTRGTFSFGGTWTSGPWQLGGVYQYNNGARAADLNDWGYSVAGAYDFGIFRLAGVWEQIRYDTPSGSLKRNFWGVSGTLDIGPGQLYAWYGNGGDGSGGAAAGTRVGGLAKGPDTSADHYEISYTYPLSKRTSVYAGYVKIDNDDNASYNFATNAIGNLAVGGKPEGFLVGMCHNF